MCSLYLWIFGLLPQPLELQEGFSIDLSMPWFGTYFGYA
ncbi:hypothetical protein GLYMA_15G141550v4 [Glycine max]|nr:hypothetical protein GLYMA_15G141550v4 [Glycine max]KAH1147126.1 hypothetical protein GYH30_042339 [Glycine max]